MIRPSISRSRARWAGARLAATDAVAAIAPVSRARRSPASAKTRGVLVVGVDPARAGHTVRAVTGRYLDATTRAASARRAWRILRVAVDEVTLVTQAADGSIGAGRYQCAASTSID